MRSVVDRNVVMRRTPVCQNLHKSLGDFVVRTSYSVLTQTYIVQYSLLHTYAIWYSLLLLGYKPVQRVTVLNTVGNCNTMVSIIILWDHRRICGPSLTETSLCGAHQYVGISRLVCKLFTVP